MGASRSIDDVIAPLNRANFLRLHWGRGFAHLPGAVGRFTELLTWDELNAVLERHRLAPPRLRLMQDGRPVDPTAWMSPRLGRELQLDGGKLAACLAGGATLVLDAVEELAPRVRGLSDSFRDALGAGNYVNLYASWRDQAGLDLHWDSQDTIILQLAGRKRWTVFAPTRLHPLQDDIAAPARPSSPPLWQGVLEDGDALYLPRGWWHFAQPLDEPSLHLTIATVPPTGIDLLNRIVADLRDHDELRADLPASDDLEGQRAWLRRLRSLLDGAFEEDIVACFRREWVAASVPRAHIRLPEAPYAQFAAIGDDATARLSASHRLALVPSGADVEFTANGLCYVVAADLAPALNLLTDVRAVDWAELVHVIDASAYANLRDTLGAMARAGIIVLESRGTQTA